MSFPTFKVGLLNINWSNGSREKPSNLIPHKTMEEFVEMIDTKINWENKNVGLVTLTGHYNYLVFRDVEYFFLNAIRVLDVEKNEFVYALDKDHWMEFLASQNSYIRGSLVKTLDENVLWKYLQNTKGIIGEPNQQIVFHLNPETVDEDCGVCSFVSGVNIKKFKEDQFGHTWNLTVEDLKRFLENIKSEKNKNVSTFKYVTPYIIATTPLRKKSVWKNYIGKLINEWIDDENITLGVASNVNEIAPAVLKHLTQGRGSAGALKQTFVLTKRKGVGSVTDYNRIFQTQELRGRSVTELNFADITEIELVTVKDLEIQWALNKDIFDLISTTEETQENNIFGVGQRFFSPVERDVTFFNKLKHTPAKSFKQWLTFDLEKIENLGLKPVLDTYEIEGYTYKNTARAGAFYYSSWMWTAKIFPKIRTTHGTGFYNTANTELGVLMYAIDDYKGLTKKTSNTSNPCVYTEDATRTSLPFITGVKLDGVEVDCGSEKISYTEVYGESSKESFWLTYNWSYLWGGELKPFADIETDLLTTVKYTDLTCQKVDGVLTVEKENKFFNFPTDNTDYHNFFNKRRKSTIIVEEKQNSDFILEKGDIFWSNLTHGLFKKQSWNGRLLIGDALDAETPQICLFYDQPTTIKVEKSELRSIEKDGWQFGVLKAHHFDHTPSRDVNNLISRVENEVDSYVNKLYRTFSITPPDKKPHDEDEYTTTLTAFLEELKTFDHVKISIDGVAKFVNEFQISEIRHSYEGKTTKYAKFIEWYRKPQSVTGSNIRAAASRLTYGLSNYFVKMVDAAELGIPVSQAWSVEEEFPEDHYWNHGGIIQYSFLKFVYQGDGGRVKDDVFSLEIQSTYTDLKRIARLCEKHFGPYKRKRIDLTTKKDYFYQSWETLEEVSRQMEGVQPKLKQHFKELAGKLNVDPNNTGVLDRLLSTIVRTFYQADVDEGGITKYTDIDEEYLKRAPRNQILPIHCFKLKIGENVEFFAFIKWEKTWTEPVIELVICNDSTLKHVSMEKLTPVNPQNLTTSCVYTAINQKNYLWVYGQIFPIYSKLVSRIGEIVDFTFNVTKLEMEDSLFTRYRIFFEGSVGEVLDTVITIPTKQLSGGMGIVDWIALENLNANIARDQEVRRLQMLDANEKRRLADQTYSNKKEDIETKISTHSRQTITGVLGMIGTAAVTGITSGRPAYAAIGLVKGAADLYEREMENSESLRVSHREKMQGDMNAAISLNQTNMYMSIDHKTAERREQNQLLELSFNMRNAVVTRADEIEALSNLVTDGKNVALLHHKPRSDLLEDIKTYYNRYGVDVFINDFTLLLEDSNIDKIQIYEFSHVDEVVTSGSFSKKYIKEMFLAGVRLEKFNYKVNNSDIDLQRQTYLAKVQKEQVERETARLQAETLQLKIAEQRVNIELKVEEIKQQLETQVSEIVSAKADLEIAKQAEEKAKDDLLNVELNQQAIINREVESRIVTAVSDSALGKVIEAEKEKTRKIQHEYETARDELVTAQSRQNSFREVLEQLAEKKKTLIKLEERFLREMLHTLNRHINPAWGNWVYLIVRIYGDGAYDSGPLYPNYFSTQFQTSAGYWSWYNWRRHVNRISSLFDPNVWLNTQPDRMRSLNPVEDSLALLVSKIGATGGSFTFFLYSIDQDLYPAVSKSFYNTISSFDSLGIPSFTKISRYKSNQRVTTAPYVDGKYLGLELFHFAPNNQHKSIYIVVHQDYWSVPGDETGLQRNHKRLMDIQWAIEQTTGEIKKIVKDETANLVHSSGFDRAYIDNILSAVTNDFVE